MLPLSIIGEFQRVRFDFSKNKVSKNFFFFFFFFEFFFDFFFFREQWFDYEDVIKAGNRQYMYKCRILDRTVYWWKKFDTIRYKIQRYTIYRIIIFINEFLCNIDSKGRHSLHFFLGPCNWFTLTLHAFIYHVQSHQ